MKVSVFRNSTLSEVVNMCRRSLVVLSMSCLLLPLLGCSQSSTEAPSQASAASQDHAHNHEHESPKSFAEAVAGVAKLRDTIRDAFAAKDDDQAHEPLHEVGHLLEHLPELAEKHSPPIDSAAVKKDADELFDLFGKVDEKMHGAEGASYTDVADKIDASIDRLQKLLAAAGGQSTSRAQEP